MVSWASKVIKYNYQKEADISYAYKFRVQFKNKETTKSMFIVL